MKRRVFQITLVLIMLGTGVAEANSKVVLFVMDGVSWQELQQATATNYQQLMGQGAVALMNVKTAGQLEPVDTYLTIACGNRARGGAAGRLSFNAAERVQGITAADIYQRRIRELQRPAAVVNLGLAQLKEANQESAYQAQVGNLGSILTAENLNIAVLGNADTEERYRRQIALLGINKYGVIKQGDIGHHMNSMVAQYPSSYLTNQRYLMQQFDKYWEQSDLLIIESGATSRIEAVKDKLLSAKFDQAKEKALTRVDKLLAAVVERLNFESDYLIFLAPTPAKEYLNCGYQLSWVAVVGPEIKSGLLTSETTKQLGLVTNLDILPTLNNYLAPANKRDFSGQKLKAVASENSIQYLTDLNQDIKTIFSWRPVVVKQFIVLQIIIILTAALIIIFKPFSAQMKTIIRYAVLTVNWLPLFFIFSIKFTSLPLIAALMLWLSSSFLIAYYTSKVSFLKGFKVLLLPNILISSSLLIDLWTGGQLLKVSILGYSPVIGARYYGIGNEYMGLLIGTTIVIVTLIFELNGKVDNKILVTSCLLLVITIGAPNLGANFGGLISASLISALTYFYLQNYNLNLNYIVKILLIVIIAILMLVVVDIYSGASTHVARLVLRIKEFGIEELLKIIHRKLAINVRLLQWTIWTKVLLAFVFLLVILFKNPRGLAADVAANYPCFTAGFKALLVGSLVAGLVNDSGVVVVATLLLIPVFTLVYLVFQQIDLGEEGNKC
ncbi:MAG: hypothetical protein ACQERJ_04335 [Bacillota bacterium]